MKSVALFVVYLNIFSILSPSWGHPPPWNNRPHPPTGHPPPWDHRPDPPTGHPPPWDHRPDPPTGHPPPWDHRPDPPTGHPPPWDNRPDPATGLTPRQKRIIRETWASVRKYPLSAGRAIMLEYFARYPHYQKLFKSFRHVPIGDLPNNPEFQNLCVAIINSLSSVIDSLDNPNVLVNSLLALGRGHISYGVTKQQYIDLAGTMAHVLRTTLGPRWNPEVSATWVQTLNTINSIIFRAYD